MAESFNPRPRAGGDAGLAYIKLVYLSVSIHAPARGATRLRPVRFPDRGCFNPRPRAGGDFVADRIMALLEVSIHAPARGATAHPTQNP